MIIFDLPREKHAKTTLFVNIETEIADFDSRRGDSGVKVSLERVGVSLERVEFSLERDFGTLFLVISMFLYYKFFYKRLSGCQNPCVQRRLQPV